VFQCDDVGEVAARLGGDDLVLVGQTVRELCTEDVEDRSDLIPSRPFIPAPNNVSGSERDHIAMRCLASPLCSAVSAAVIRDAIASSNCSVSVIDPLLTAKLDTRSN
jgi:hypothetical protein